MIADLLVGFFVTTALGGIVQAVTGKPAPVVVWRLLRQLARRHRHTTAPGRVPAAVLTADRTRRFDPKTALRVEARARQAANQHSAGRAMHTPAGLLPADHRSGGTR